MFSWKQGEENDLAPRQTQLAFILVMLQGLIVVDLILVAVTRMTAPFTTCWWKYKAVMLESQGCSLVGPIKIVSQEWQRHLGLSSLFYEKGERYYSLLNSVHL